MDERIVLFDGVCNLCVWSVQFIIEHDPHRKFRFASLQSPVGQQLSVQYGLPPLGAGDDSVMLIENGRVYTHSTASLRVARELSGWVRFASVLMVIPSPIRNVVYRFIASTRYRLFGKKAVCWLPTPELNSRFLGE